MLSIWKFTHPNKFYPPQKRKTMARFRSNFRSDPTNVFAGLIFGWLGVVILGAIGWVANIVQLVTHMNEPLTTMMIVKMVGTLVAPLGAVLGYIGMF